MDTFQLIFLFKLYQFILENEKIDYISGILTGLLGVGFAQSEKNILFQPIYKLNLNNS